MSLIVDGHNSGNFQPAPAGSHLARCVQVIDMGTQHSPMFNKWSHKIRLGFELPTELHVFDQDRGHEPYLVSGQFTVSFRENSNLRPFLESWRGKKFAKEELKQFDFKKLLGQPCILAVGHDEKEDGRVFASINGIGPLMKGQEIPAQVLPSVIYEIEQGKNGSFQKLPEWLQEAISKCREWNEEKPTNGSSVDETDMEAHRQAAKLAAETDDVPF